MTRVVAVSGGFLLGVLWMDLMFDVQVRGLAQGPLPEAVLASIAGYYRRVTTEADPMSRLVAAAMAVTLLGTTWQLARRSLPRAVAGLALALCAGPILLAALRVVPSAVRLGSRADGVELQSALARTIYGDHVLCFGAMLAFVALQVAAGGRLAGIARPAR